MVVDSYYLRIRKEDEYFLSRVVMIYHNDYILEYFTCL